MTNQEVLDVAKDDLNNLELLLNEAANNGRYLSVVLIAKKIKALLKEMRETKRLAMEGMEKSPV